MSLELVPERIYSQYRDKQKFVKWLEIARKQGKSLDEVLEKISLMWDADTAEGAQIDIVGSIVGINRDFINKIEMDTFQFDDDEVECGNDSAVFSATSVAGDAQMSDGLFRLLIKAKILKNNRNATIEDIIEQMVLLVGVDFLRINNPENMTFSIEFAGELTPLQRYALFNESIIQIPQGVLFNGFLEMTDVYEFGDIEAEFGNDEVMCSDFGGTI